MRLSVIDKTTGRKVDDDLASGWMIDEDGLLMMRDGNGKVQYVEQGKFLTVFNVEKEKDVFVSNGGKLYKLKDMSDDS